MTHRRGFFEEFAGQVGRFDPLIPENWYSVDYAQVQKHKVWRQEEGGRQEGSRQGSRQEGSGQGSRWGVWEMVMSQW